MEKITEEIERSAKDVFEVIQCNYDDAYNLYMRDDCSIKEAKDLIDKLDNYIKNKNGN